MSSDYDEREGYEEDHTDRNDYPEEVWDQVQAERRRLEGGDDDDYFDAVPEQENDGETETFILLISRLYDQAFSSANMIESCARYFGWPDLDIRALGEKASNALEQAERADDAARRGQLVTALCEVLESE